MFLLLVPILCIVCSRAPFASSLVSLVVAPKRKTGEPHPPNPMHVPPDQQSVGSSQTQIPLDGFDVVLPQSPAPRHSQEVTQQAPFTSSTQQRTPLRLSQKTTQPMEWTPTSTTVDGTSQPAPPQLAELPVNTTHDCQYRQLSADAGYESRAQYQQTGEGRMAHIVDAAQMTHPISSAEDIDMQPIPTTARPDTHDIATPRRRIGGRCRKWAVSTQATNKRNCAACTMCSLQFTKTAAVG